MGNSDYDDVLGRMRAEADRMYQDLVGPARWVVVHHSHTWRPPTDVFETDDNVVVRVEVAGMRESEFNVSLSDRLLVITGFRQDPSPKVAYHQMEVRFGEFRVEVYLHWAINEAGIQAAYDNGFLQVILPKARKRQIPIAENGS
jgi:HSP20 family protein